MSINIKKFASDYATIYAALYKSDAAIDYSRLVDTAEQLTKNNEPYKHLLRMFYEYTCDFPISDRELAAFVMTARVYEAIESDW